MADLGKNYNCSKCKMIIGNKDIIDEFIFKIDPMLCPECLISKVQHNINAHNLCLNNYLKEKFLMRCGQSYCVEQVYLYEMNLAYIKLIERIQIATNFYKKEKNNG